MTPKTATTTTAIDTDAAIDIVPGNANLPAPVDAGNALVQTVDEEWAGVDDGDLSPDEGAAALALSFLPLSRKIDGGFADPDTGEVTRELEFVWMANLKTRAYWNAPFGEGEPKPTCRSVDSIRPDEKLSIEVQNEDCATCPHSEWPDSGRAPKCHEAIEVMAFLPDPHGFGRLARLRFAGLAFGPARYYLRSFRERIPKLPPIAYITRVVLEEEDTDNGKFLVPRFMRSSELTRAQAQPLIEERDRRIEEWRREIAADEVSRDEDVPAQAPPRPAGGYEPFPDDDEGGEDAGRAFE